MSVMPGSGSVRWRAPGRVNLIGEHTDYNEGFALPIAIDRACTARIARQDSPMLTMRSRQRDGRVEIALADLAPERLPSWARYAAAVPAVLRDRGIGIPGLRIDLDSDVPAGAGLSSSAALICAVATGMNDLLGLGLTGRELLQLSIDAENDFVGAPTGGMDQLAALFGKSAHALFCDMRSFDIRPIPFEPERDGMSLLVINTGVSHSHTDDEYGARRTSCATAARILGVPALRDVTDLATAEAALPTDELRRCVRHVVTENARVLASAELLRSGAVRDLGPLLNASHDSLRDEYRVSSPELDLAVDSMREAGALGARMTGGGFGGSAIALLPPDRIDGAIVTTTKAYHDRGYHPPEMFVAHPADGASRVAEG